MTTKSTEAAPMRAELLVTAGGLHRVGIVSDGTLNKITAREFDLDKLPKLKPPSGAEIVAMRERAKMSQAVFARVLNAGTSTRRQWEREEKRPRDAEARLLAVVKVRGVRGVL